MGLGPSPLDHHIFGKKHPREKCQKVDPSSASKLQFSLKKMESITFCQEIAVLRPASGFLKKIEKKIHFGIVIQFALQKYASHL